MLKQILLFSILTLLAGACTTEPVRSKHPVTVVEIMHVPTRLAESFPVKATLEYTQAVPVSFPVSGKLENGEMTLKPGTKFRKGQLLFQINNREAYREYSRLKKQLIANVDQMQTKVDTEKAKKWTVFLAGLVLGQLLPDFPAYGLSLEEVEHLAKLNITEDYLELQKMEHDMKHYFFIAPFDGEVLEIAQQPGAVLTKGRQVAVIGRNNQQIIRFTGQERAPTDTVVNVLTESGKVIGTARLESVRKQPNQTLKFRYKPQLTDKNALQLPASVLLGITPWKVHYLPSTAVHNNSVCLVRNGRIVRKTAQIKDGFVSNLTEADVIVVNYLHQLPKGKVRFKMKD